MAADKKREMSGLLNPANLWGKPLPRSLSRPVTEENPEEETMTSHEEESDENEDVEPAPVRRKKNVRAEMDDIADPTDDDLRAEDEDDEEFDDEEGDDADEEGDETDEDETNELDEDEESESDGVEASSASGDDDDDDDDDDVTENVTKTKKGNAAMAETKKKSISDHVREEIDRRKKSGDSLRGVDIVTALASRKIKVSPAQVSQLLKKAGISLKARGSRKLKESAAAGEERSRTANKAKPKKSEAAQPPRSTAARSPALASDTSFSFQLPMAQLQAAEKFVATCGGLKKAEQILTLAAQLASRSANG